MNAQTESIKLIEEQIDKALWELEVYEKLEEALQIYTEAESKLNGLPINADDPEYSEQQRVLSYCLMRQGNILRQLGKPKEALAISKQEISAAKASGDEITLARALMSNGTNQLIAGEVEQGLQMVGEARQIFEKGDSFDHKQGLGWYWILQADLAQAGLTTMEPGKIIEATTRAIEILTPIENWPGVARAYAGRAKAYDSIGEIDKAEKDRSAQKIYESKIESGEKLG
jgi:tetratricopeptide (TPR) repeat protein